MEKGYIQVYTGNGKGKTTAALGLSIRSAAAGKKVFIAQFVKGMHYSELDILKDITNIELKQYGRGCFIYNKATKEDIKSATNGLKETAIKLKEGRYSVIILDEATIAIHFNLFSFDELWKAITARAPHVEVIITGRYAPDELIHQADLVTEMKEIKHYYTKGIEARVGIEK